MNRTEKFLKRINRLLDRLESLIPSPRDENVDVDNAIAWRWRSDGKEKRLQPIRRFNSIALDDLLHIERQKQTLERNTRQFLAG